jgi:hypothetical protein
VCDDDYWQKHLLINKSECLSVCLCVSVCMYFICMYFKKKLYILLVSASLLRFLIIGTIETHVSMVDERN